jgi:hypothetical protein
MTRNPRFESPEAGGRAGLRVARESAALEPPRNGAKRGDPATTLVVTPAAPGAAPTTTTRSVVSGSTRTDTTVTVTPKAAPMAAPTTGAGEAVAGERG